MNIHPERQWPKAPHLNYDEYWLNARTLYRNVVGCFSSDMALLLTPEIIAELMHDEWKAIQNVIHSDTKLETQLYLCNYKDIYRRWKHHTVFRSDKTSRQIDERKRMERSIQQFIEDIGEDKDFMKVFDTDITPSKKEGKYIIQTHMAIDLLSYKNFEDLDLLESHTGNIKNRSAWYTKYNNGKELSNIPFTQYFLRVFGDKEFFAPMDGDLRRAITELAGKYQWGPLTTDSRIRMNIDQLKNPYHKAVLKDMM